MNTKIIDRTGRRKGETLTSSTYARLQRDIVEGSFPPGSKLRIRELADRYAVGFTPIREALNRLSRDGLVRQSDLRGFATAPLTPADLDELTRTRCWLNELALRRSIELGDTAWEEKIVLTHYRMTRVARWLSAGDNSEASINPDWETAHRGFHSALLGACDSSWLLGYCEQLFDAADRYRTLSRSPALARGRQADEHQPIMEAAIARDAELAVRLLMQHFNKTAELSHRAMRGSASS